nr:hypothetical protein [Tanacetum cinerariifolium]
MKEQAYNVDRDKYKSLTTTAISMNLQMSVTMNSLWVEFCKSEVRLQCSYKLHIYKDKMKELPNQVEINVPTVPKVSSKAVISVMLGVNKPENVLIGNPNLSKVKSMCCFLRMKPISEVTAEELAKRRTRSVCGGKEGHNKRTCINEPASKKPKVQATLKEKAALKQQASQP